MMLLDTHLIDTVSNVIEASLAVLAVGLTLWTHRSTKLLHAESTLELRNQASSQAAAGQVDKKVEDYLRMVGQSGVHPLQALRRVKLQEIGSDQEIRRAIERMADLSNTDPWEGKSAPVQGVDLEKFFIYCEDHKTDLATADLALVAHRVKNLTGPRAAPPVRERPRRVLGPSAGSSMAIALLAVLMVNDHWRGPGSGTGTPGDTASTATIGPSTVPGFQEEGESHTKAADTASAPDRASPTVTVDGRHANIDVRSRVEDTWNLMRVMNDSAVSGAYDYAIRGLKEARWHLDTLQTQGPGDPPRELVQVVDSLDGQLRETIRKCRNELVIGPPQGRTFQCR